MQTTKEEIQKLQQDLTGDLEHDAPIRERIAKLKAKAEGRDPDHSTSQESQFECIGCGS